MKFSLDISNICPKIFYLVMTVLGDSKMAETVDIMFINRYTYTDVYIT